MTIKKDKRPIPIGISDFKKLRENNYFYVDKSLLIKEIWTKAEVTLFTRPRRFGKTLNMSMLYYFFDSSESSAKTLFNGLKISTEDNGKYLAHMNKYPVFFITLKSLDFMNFENFSVEFNKRLAVEFEKFKYLLESEHVSKYQKEVFVRIISRQATPTDLRSSLQFMSHILFAHHKIKPILLIDEYDAPIHSAFHTGQYEECIQFMRGLYSDALKDNTSLEKAVMTGILRISKESIFSGFNNPDIATVLSPNYANYFGLTEDELKNSLNEYEVEKEHEGVKHWYNGYQFGKSVTIYNPWSILSWLHNDGQFQAYWSNTSSNELVRSLFVEHRALLQEDVFKIIAGESITMRLSEDMHFPSLKTNCSKSEYFTLLLHAGYLTVKNKEEDGYYTLKIPNIEIQSIFRKMVGDWLAQFAPNLEENISLLILNALKKEDMKTFEKHFSNVVLQVMSYHDFAKQPENAFHCFTAGFLSWLSHEYEVRSNRETGEGRADI
ncbi:MAG: AAA family ATPase, partial [Bdellovibrionota bacterium]